MDQIFIRRQVALVAAYSYIRPGSSSFLLAVVQRISLAIQLGKLKRKTKRVEKKVSQFILEFVIKVSTMDLPGPPADESQRHPSLNK